MSFDRQIDALSWLFVLISPNNDIVRRAFEEERIKKRIYKTRDLARADIFDYIEVFYDRTRRHSHLGGVRPEAFERASF